MVWDMTTHDPVNHPAHYCSHPSGIECIEITEHMPFCEGNATKYLWRSGQKGSLVEDLRKSRWYIERAIAIGRPGVRLDDAVIAKAHMVATHDQWSLTSVAIHALTQGRHATAIGYVNAAISEAEAKAAST